jgi:uncharacterized protein YbjT (DUF2867 family)
MKILVTGATGHLGSLVVEHLLNHMPPERIVAGARKVENGARLAARGIEVRLCNYDDPTSLESAFHDVRRVLLVSAGGIDRRRAEGHRRVIDVAVKRQVDRLYYTSLTPGDDSVAYVMKAHLDTEVYLQESGITFTILKNGAYAEAWPTYFGSLAGDEVAIPADGPINWVSRFELAEGIAHLLVDRTRDEQFINLTGPEPIDIGEAVESVNQQFGRRLVRRIVSVEEFVARQVAAGRPEERARQWATTYEALARGEFGRVDPALADLCGRSLRTFEDVIRHSNDVKAG